MRARNDDPLVDVERVIRKPGFVQQIRNRNSLLDPASNQRFDFLYLRARGFTGEGDIKRQAQRPKNQKRGFVPRVVRAVAVMQPCGTKLLLGIADQLEKCQMKANLRQQGAQGIQVDLGQLLELGERDVLVQLVDAGVDRSELQDLGADLDDEA